MDKKTVAAEVKATEAKVEEKAAEVKAEVKATEKKAENAAAKVKTEAKKTAAKAEKAVKTTAKKAEKTVKTAAKKVEKKVAAPKAAEPVVLVQFGGAEKDVAELVEAAKAAFKAEKARTAINDLKLYVKPEEQAAYYVVNGEFTGKVSF